MRSYCCKITIMVLILVSANNCFAAAPCMPVLLKCEYSVNPLGIDVSNPRLSWLIQDERRGAVQTAYQVMVGSDSSALLQGNTDAWNSGKIASDKTNSIQYNGSALVSRKK